MNQLYHIEIELGQARALVANTTGLVQQAKAIHHTSATATAALGRAMTAAVLMGVLQKDKDDRVTLTLRGDGPYSPVVCVSNGAGDVKGYLEQPELELEPKPNGKLDVGGGVGKNGRLILVRDLGMREPYVGQTSLVSGEIAEDLAAYLTYSEQQPSLVALGVRLEKGEVVSSCGVLIQPLPGCTEEVLQKLEAMAPNLGDVSTHLQETGSLEAFIKDVFQGIDYEILEENLPRWHCACSREHIEKVLLSMGKAELKDMIAKQHGAEVTCHFCTEQYRFTEQELETLIQQATKA